jgi:hypothetical protein
MGIAVIDRRTFKQGDFVYAALVGGLRYGCRRPIKSMTWRWVFGSR